MERRFLNNKQAHVEVRNENDNTPKIAGYGAVYYRADAPGSEYWLYDDIVERIMPGAFKRAVQEDDIRALFNHDPNMVLGRRTAGTMTLVDDETGLRYEIEPPQTRGDVVQSVRRGDVTGSSFSFLVRKQVLREEQRDGKPLYIRELVDVEVFDVGPVTFPAYEATSAQVRSAGGVDDVRAAVEAYKAQRAADLEAAAAMRRRIMARVRAIDTDAGV
jgi:hypothetical protein